MQKRIIEGIEVQHSSDSSLPTLGCPMLTNSRSRLGGPYSAGRRIVLETTFSIAYYSNEFR